MELYLIRHAQSHINVTWDVHNQNSSLTDLGRQQAAALQDWLTEEEHTADVLYASTMLRTQETAEYVSAALKIDAVSDDRIREIGMCYADGRPIADADLPKVYSERKSYEEPFSPRAIDPPYSESWGHFRSRIGHFFEDLITNHQGQKVYVVAHGGVIGAIFENVFNTGPYRRFSVHNYNTSWTRFEYRADHIHTPWYLWEHNRVDHLIKAGLVS